MNTITREKIDVFLNDLGFENVGKWIKTDTGIDYTITKYASDRKILYLFISGEQVLYIGKTITH